MLHKSSFKSFGLRFGQGEGLVQAWCIQTVFSNQNFKTQPKGVLKSFLLSPCAALTIAEYFTGGKFPSSSVLPSYLEMFTGNALDVLPT